jgi:hypothetical protein
MESKYINSKPEAIRLRKLGHTYGEIKKILGVNIPKSTLFCWLSKLKLTNIATDKLKLSAGNNIKKAHLLALKSNKEKRIKHLAEIATNVEHLKKIKKDKNVAKIILAVLYLGEGGKSGRSSLMLGNSDPAIIRLFLALLRQNYSIDEGKFRCTVQCRADQDIPELEKFWSKITDIPPRNFYKARVDSRTIGKKSKKPSYKGVCRIDYFSADLFNEIKMIMEIVCELGI